MESGTRTAVLEYGLYGKNEIALPKGAFWQKLDAKRALIADALAYRRREPGTTTIETYSGTVKVNSDEADATLSPTVEADRLVEPTDILPEPAGAFAASPQTTGSAERMRYRAALAGWMASKDLKELRMGGNPPMGTVLL